MYLGFLPRFQELGEIAKTCNQLKLKRPVNRKGTPPAQSTTSQNLAKPASGEKVPLQLKISPELRREFRVYAAERDIDISVLFADMWAFYKEHHG